MKLSTSFISTVTLTLSLLFFTFQVSPSIALVFSSMLLIGLFIQEQKTQREKKILKKQLTNHHNRDIHYKKSMQLKNKELEEKYFIYDLTKLPNRNALMDKVINQEHYTLLLINIDAFKDINDFYDLQAGDSLIKQLAVKFAKTPLLFEHTFYHLHIDEFAFLITNKLSLYEIKRSIKEIERFIQKQTFYASMKEEILFTLSFGVSLSKEQSPMNKALITEASHALNFTKNHTETWAIFDDLPEVSNDYEKNLYWLQKLRLAIEEDRIEPYFQPIVNQKTKKIVSQEALMRLIEKNGPALSPYLFLEIAKKSKLYTTLTKIMIEKTFAKCEKNKTHFSINFSYEDMIDNEVLELLTLKLQKGTIGKRFTAEILESESITNYDLVKNFIDTIKAYGAKVAIDDFGSGYSNFERLFKLDIDYIKIDGSIIKDIDENKQLRIITETIVAFAKKTEIGIVAEFVHSKEIVDILEKMDVTQMQGFYFAEPSKDIMIDFPKEHSLVE